MSLSNKKLKELTELQQTEGPTNVAVMRTLQNELHVMMEQEDLKWRQRAKDTWLKHDDRNTKYFHACANQQKKGNLLLNILDERDKW